MKNGVLKIYQKVQQYLYYQKLKEADVYAIYNASIKILSHELKCIVNNTMNIILSCLFNYMFVSFFTKAALKCDFLCASKIMVEYFDRALSLWNVELLYLKT